MPFVVPVAVAAAPAPLSGVDALLTRPHAGVVPAVLPGSKRCASPASEHDARFLPNIAMHSSPQMEALPLRLRMGDNHRPPRRRHGRLSLKRRVDRCCATLLRP